MHMKPGKYIASMHEETEPFLLIMAKKTRNNQVVSQAKIPDREVPKKTVIQSVKLL